MPTSSMLVTHKYIYYICTIIRFGKHFSYIVRRTNFDGSIGQYINGPKLKFGANFPAFSRCRFGFPEIQDFHDPHPPSSLPHFTPIRPTLPSRRTWAGWGEGGGGLCERTRSKLIKHFPAAFGRARGLYFGDGGGCGGVENSEDERKGGGGRVRETAGKLGKWKMLSLRQSMFTHLMRGSSRANARPLLVQT